MARLIDISGAASLALHAMALLAAEKGRRYTNQEMANLLGASGHHLAKVMQLLAKRDFVDSVRGPQGGFLLAKAAEDVSLLEIYEAVEGRQEVENRPLASPIGSIELCILEDVLQSLHVGLREYLGKTSLAVLADGLRTREPRHSADGKP